MIRRIISFSVFNPSIIIALVVLTSIIGVMSFFKLPIDAVPDITNTQVQIITRVDGLVPEEIERKITFPIEAALSGILGVKQNRSVTRFGISHITVIFEDWMDIYRARQLVTERLSRIAGDLPAGIVPELGPISTGLGEIFHYQIEAKEIKSGKDRLYQLMEMRAIQDWFVRLRLLKVEGVTEVNTIGGYEKQFHVQPDFNLMAKYAVHFEDIAQAIKSNNVNVGGGHVEKGNEQYLIQAEGLLQSIEDIENLPVKINKSLFTIKVKDVAKVTLAEELRNGAALVDGEETVIGTVMMTMGENSRVVAAKTALEIQQISEDLPEGYFIKPLYDRSVMVDETLNTVKKNLLFGCLLVVLFLFLLVGGFQAALIVASVIPVALLTTFTLMRINCISGNLMSLGCLDFGVIIGSAVVVVDAVMRSISNNKGKKLSRLDIKDKTVLATERVFNEAFWGQVVIILVFIPIFALTGVEGKMFTPIATTFIYALVAALILSFTFVPALCGLILPVEFSDKKPWSIRLIESMFNPAFEKVLKYKALTIATALVMIISSLFIFSRMGGEFIPQLDEGSIVLDIVRPSRISISESIRQQKITDTLIKKFPEVRHTFARLGTSSIPADPAGVNLGDSIVILKPKRDWPILKYGRSRTKAELTEEIAIAVQKAVPEQAFILTQPMQMKFNDLLEGIKADVSVKVFGPDILKLERVSNDIAHVLRIVDGTNSVQMQLKDRVPLLKVKPDTEIMRKLGFGNATILESVSRTYQGENIGFIYEGVRRFPIVMRLDLSKRADEEYLKNLPVGLSSELQVSLKDVAELKFKETFHTIFREDGERRTAVLVSLKDRDVQSYVLDAMKKVQKQVELPTGYSLDWGGNFKNLQKAKGSLYILVPITLAFIFFIIYTIFQNIWHSLIVFSCVPLSLVGGIFFLYIIGLNFSVSAGVGFIALFGISVLNGVILVSQYRELQEEGLSVSECVKKGTRTLLRPIFMTSLVDAFGFLPMMLATGLGSEVQRPLATVVVGGILTATVLTLLVLPLLYLSYESRSTHEKI